MKLIKKCEFCKKEFKTYSCVINRGRGRGKYCSKKCCDLARKGKPTWNKGIKMPQISGQNNPHWKGGKTIHSEGYIYVNVQNHPFNHKNYVYEHRLVMEQILGRYLKPKETIHHKNGVRNDNRPENLMLFNTRSEHLRYHKFCK